jgi:hypothetical protein
MHLSTSKVWAEVEIYTMEMLAFAHRETMLADGVPGTFHVMELKYGKEHAI